MKLWWRIIIALVFGITAISTNIHSDMRIFGNYIGFIILNCFLDDYYNKINEENFNKKLKFLESKINEMENKYSLIKHWDELTNKRIKS